MAAHGAATVAEVVERFGQPRGLARSTVLTMMERLRKKGHLSRRQVDGIYRYATRTAPGDAVQHAVASFVDRTLGGSVTPFVTFLSEATRCRTRSWPNSRNWSRDSRTGGGRRDARPARWKPSSIASRRRRSPSR